MQLRPLTGDRRPHFASAFGRFRFADGLPVEFEQRVPGDDDDGVSIVKRRGSGSEDPVDDRTGLGLRQCGGEIADGADETILDGPFVDLGDDDDRVDPTVAEDRATRR